MKALNLISFLVLVVGGLNWLIIGLFQFDLVAGIFGSQAAIGSRIIYVIVGLAALYLIYSAIVERGKINLAIENSSSQL